MRSNRGTPVYRFDWENGDSRRTDDDNAFEEEPHPDAVMALAALARDDPECEVTTLGMAN